MPESAPVTFQPEEWNTIKELFAACEPLSPEGREQWLASQAVAENVRAEVRRLLQAANPASFMERGAARDLLNHFVALEKLGQFRIVRQIGMGGMGVVYEAIDERLGRRTALKVLQLGAGEDPSLRQRLLWEARAASCLNHLNIVTIYEVGTADDVDYIAMEYVEGQSLAAILAAAETLPVASAVDLALQIAAALEAAHAGGVIHRDLKPGNIMVTGGGIVKLLDFGLAKRVPLDSGQVAAAPITEISAPQTIQGSFAGTAPYVSPEIALGQAADARSDIFSFGSVLYELLTHHRAFRGATAVAVLASVIYADPDPPRRIAPDLDIRLERILNGCLRKLPADRFSSMSEVRERLQEMKETSLQAIDWRKTVRATAIAAALLSVLAGLLVAVRLASQRETGSVIQTKLSKITSDTGLTGFPALSPDGKLIAYSSDRGVGNLDLWVQQTAGDDPIRLTSDPADDYQAAFSPDGTRLAFRSERNGGAVYTIPALGGSGQLLVPGCHDPRYSPDGKWVACWTGTVGGALYPDRAHILIVPASGGKTISFRPDFQTAAFPIWTSDSRRLLFLGRRTGADGKSVVDWWVASVNGTEASPTGALARFRNYDLTPPPGLFWTTPEWWIENRHSVLFTAQRGDATNIWQLPLDGSGKSIGDPIRLTLGASFDSAPRLADKAEPRALAFASLAVDVGIWKIPLTAAGNTADRPELLVSGQPGIGSPSLSADGRIMVYSSYRDGESRILARDLTTGNQRVLTAFASDRIVRPTLSGDGKTLVFANNFSIDRLRLPDGVPDRICTRCGTPTYVNFDGSEIVFESATSEERLQLWMRGKLRPLIHASDAGDGLQFGGRLSPNGKWVVLCAASRDSAARQIVVVPNAPDRPLGAEEWIQISEDANFDEREPYWAPDGKRIYYLSEKDGFRCIWARPVDPASGRPSGSAYAVAHFHHARQAIRTMRPTTGEIGLSAVGDALFLTIADLTGNVWLQLDPQLQ